MVFKTRYHLARDELQLAIRVLTYSALLLTNMRIPHTSIAEVVQQLHLHSFCLAPVQDEGHIARDGVMY